jgi:hypothetical protein
MVSGSSVAGYDVQHTNFDWNLYQFGPPPFYPATSSSLFVRFEQAPDEKLAILNNLDKSQLTPLVPPQVDSDGFTCYYSYVLDGVTYYYGNTFNVTPGHYSGKAQMTSTPLYRITWKEQISEPVKP